MGQARPGLPGPESWRRRTLPRWLARAHWHCPCVCWWPCPCPPRPWTHSGSHSACFSFRDHSTRMGAASRQDFSFKAMLTLSCLSLACFAGAASTGEPPQRRGTSVPQWEGEAAGGRRRSHRAGAGRQGSGRSLLPFHPRRVLSWASVVSHETMGLDQRQGFHTQRPREPGRPVGPARRGPWSPGELRLLQRDTHFSVLANCCHV